MSKAKLYGTLLACGLIAAGCASMCHESKGKEGDEVKVKFDDLPAAVKTTLAAQAPGAKIDTVDKESEKGTTIYEADAVVDGKPWEIKVGEDGKLISKKIDDEKGEK